MQSIMSMIINTSTAKLAVCIIGFPTIVSSCVYAYNTYSYNEQKIRSEQIRLSMEQDKHNKFLSDPVKYRYIYNNFPSDQEIEKIKDIHSSLIKNFVNAIKELDINNKK